MKHFELKQLIREELKKELSRRDKEAINEYMTGEEILWKGTRVKVVKDDGDATLTILKPNGKEGMVFRKDTSLPLNESPYPLTMRKDIIANALETSNIPDEAFEPQRSKDVVVSFIRDGRPSEVYLEKMMNILKKNDVDVEFPPLKPQKDYKRSTSVDIDPSLTSAGRASRDGYTGD